MKTPPLKPPARVHASTTVQASGPVDASTSAYAPTPIAPSPSKGCSLCNLEHYVASCPQYRSKTAEQRRDFVNSKRLCFNCLRSGHRRKECKSTGRCQACGELHHTTIHLQRTSAPTVVNPSSTTSSDSVPARTRSQQETPTSARPPAVNTASSSQPVLLATALVSLISTHGHRMTSRALLDQGSELSFIRESVVQALQLPRKTSRIPLLGIGAQKQVTTRGVVSVTLQHRLKPEVEFVVEAHVLSKVTGSIPAQELQTEEWSHLSGLELADPTFAIPGPVDLLLGANIYGHLLSEDLRKGGLSAPVAQKTSLGWIVSGPTAGNPEASAPSARAYAVSGGEDLVKCVQDFWAQEVVPAPEGGRLSRTEKECEDHFRTTHSRDPTGRYIVRLPFMSTPTGGEQSRRMASYMLGRMQRRFAQDPRFAQLYTQFLQEYLDLGHMERISSEKAKTAYHLPHHGVLREASTTTKLRVVFNGSQKSSSGSTLNETLHTGPKLQQDLIDVLMRWRRHAYVFTSDIEKMYRQILVHPDDRKWQCILWSEFPERQPESFQLCTVTYGLASAPYHALRVLKQLVNDEGRRFPLAVPVLQKNTYVDDVLGGADTIELALETAVQVDKLLKAGGFNLHKWVANEEQILQGIERNRHVQREKTFGESEGEILKALGIKWSPARDAFIFTFNEAAISVTTATKRSVLSVISRMFDPLGWLAPIIISVKIFLQSLWTTKLDWDEPLTPALASRWSELTREFSFSTSFSVPRWLGISQSSFVEIHGFSDASRSALAAVVYVRVVEEDFTARVSLLISKTKVAPLKNVTIARLELSAAVLLAQLTARVRECLEFPESTPIHLWTDSTVTLTWIRADPSRWKEFIGNRVDLIQDLLPRAAWHHVAGGENPADIASRGATPTQLRDHPSWWRGPGWLSLPSTSWPSSPPLLPEDANLEERTVVVSACTASPEIWNLVSRYSVIERLVRVTARVLDAVRRFRRQKSELQSPLVLTPALLDKALLFWIGVTQRAHFTSDIDALRKGGELLRTSSLRRLTPFLDDAGILRVGGRLQKSSLDYDCKHPVLLPRHSALSHLLIEQAHRRTFHGGTQSTLALLRQRVWIVGGRAPVRSFILKCVRCTRHRGTTLTQKMGQLPSLRTQPSRPFLHSGVDYAGPFTVKTWSGRTPKTYKAFLVIFVCFCTSAVHLELATDYTTAGFLAAFRRFTGRRGVCSHLHSDCGTNFIGADQELKRLFDAASKDFAELRSLLASDRVQWHFNPPSAPHFGGKWEAGVKSVKHHLRRVVGDSLLTYEEFSTTLVQIEAILNSRPLCQLTDDPSDCTALTPGHFLIGAPLNSVPEPSVLNVSDSRLSRWEKTRSMTEHFWKRWSTEYLQRFQTTSKWLQPDSNLRAGSLVLIADERLPPARWPLARVVDLHPGSDGLVRVASVRTATGSTFKRPVVKLCLLPVAD